jgi:hypothetical protein
MVYVTISDSINNSDDNDLSNVVFLSPFFGNILDSFASEPAPSDTEKKILVSQVPCKVASRIKICAPDENFMDSFLDLNQELENYFRSFSVIQKNIDYSLETLKQEWVQFTISEIWCKDADIDYAILIDCNIEIEFEFSTAVPANASNTPANAATAATTAKGGYACIQGKKSFSIFETSATTASTTAASAASATSTTVASTTSTFKPFSGSGYKF